MALHDEFVPTMWDLQCGFGFTTVVSRKFSKLGGPDAICAPAKCKHYESKIYSTVQHKDLSIFGRARLLGIGNEEDGDTDGHDESTHPPPVCHRPRHRILTMRRGKKRARAKDAGTHEVIGSDAVADHRGSG